MTILVAKVDMRSSKPAEDDIRFETLRLYRIEHMTQVQAYQATHPQCSASTAKAKASEYIRRAEREMSTSRLLELYDLGPGRVLREISAHLRATNKLSHKGFLTGEEVADNTCRARANELLAKINGLAEKPGRTEITAGEGEGLHIIIDNG